MALFTMLNAILITPWVFMLENRPNDGFGDLTQFHYTSPTIISTVLMFILSGLYYKFILTNVQRRRYFIAYMRFFSGTRKMADLKDVYYGLIFLATMAWLNHPFNIYFRPTDELEAEEYAERFARRLLKKKLKKRFVDFREYLDLYQELRYDEFNEETKELLDDYSFLDDDDEDLMSMFDGYNAMHTAYKQQFYVFFDIFLKQQLRDAIYHKFDNVELLQSEEDRQALINLFFDQFVYKYVPYHMFWIPAAANATLEINGPHASTDITFAADTVSTGYRFLRMHKNKMELPNVKYLTSLYYELFLQDFADEMEKWRVKEHPWWYYYDVLMTYHIWDYWRLKPFGMSRWSNQNTIRWQSVLSHNYMKLEQKWQRKSRLFRWSVFKFIPVGVDFAHCITIDEEFTDNAEQFAGTQIKYFQPDEVIPYIQPIVPSNINIYRVRRIPRWIKEKIPYKYINPTKIRYNKPWKYETRYFVLYHKKNSFGWWQGIQEYDIGATDKDRWLSSFARLRDFYLATYSLSRINHYFRDDVIYLNDGDSPHNCAFRTRIANWHYNYETYMIYPPDLYQEWPRMTDSMYAYNLTKYNTVEPKDDSSLLNENPMVSYFSNNLLDFSGQGQLGFQDAGAPAMEGIIDLHHDLMFFLFVIIVFVVWMLSSTIFYFYAFDEKNDEIKTMFLIPSLRSHNVTLEVVWTIVPSLILLLIAIPSFALIYSIDEVLAPRLTIKVVGHQWYWHYDYNHTLKSTGSSYKVVTKQFDSNMLATEDLVKGQLRLLEVNKRTYIPRNTNLRVLITSADVLHSWAVPSLGIKVDACPGRLNQTPLYAKRLGVLYGQCSEICGVNHAFMPIVIQAVSPDVFVDWFNKYYVINNFDTDITQKESQALDRLATYIIAEIRAMHAKKQFAMVLDKAKRGDIK